MGLYQGTGGSVDLTEPAKGPGPFDGRFTCDGGGEETGRNLRGFHQTAADGDSGRFGAVLGFELGEYGADVELDGAFGDKELGRYLGVLEAAGDEGEHLEFPGR